MNKREVNIQTGEVTLVAMTAEEIAEREAHVPAFVSNPIQEARAAAYAAEADPLFFKAQRGEATTAEWEAKVAEIKARYPYPEEVV